MGSLLCTISHVSFSWESLSISFAQLSIKNGSSFISDCRPCSSPDCYLLSKCTLILQGCKQDRMFLLLSKWITWGGMLFPQAILAGEEHKISSSFSKRKGLNRNIGVRMALWSKIFLKIWVLAKCISRESLASAYPFRSWLLFAVH